MLIAARAVQGLGAALLSPAALSLITVIFAEGAERNKALGVWGAVAGSGGAAGVLLGGILTEYAGWEWVLFVNVPIGILAAVAAARLLPESRNAGARNFDIAGAVSVTAGLSLLVYTLVDANDAGWTSGQTLLLGAIALALLAAFVVVERRSKAPLVPFAIFRRRTITGTNIVGLLVAMALFSMFFFVSLYMQTVLGYDALKAGLAYLPLAGGIIVSAGIASVLVTRFGFKPILVSGLVLTAIGLVWFAQVDVDGGYVSDILFPSLVAARRPRLRVRADDDRRGQRRRAARDRPRLGADQHLAADRRRARPRDPRVDRQLAHRRADAGGQRRAVGAAERADGGLPARVHGRRRIRGRRRDTRGDADLQQGEPQPRRGGAARRRAAGAVPGLDRTTVASGPEATAARTSARGHEQPRVAVCARTREALRPAALRVQERELARCSGKAAAVVVEHPRLQRIARGSAADAQRARLLRVIGERRTC